VTIEADQERDGPSWPFAVAPGADAIRLLHLWLDEMMATGTIGTWYDVGSRANQGGRFALVEYQRDDDGVRACAAWAKAKD
jgi:hypothetical protein